MERRNKAIQIYVEPSIYEAVNIACAKMDTSISEYMRNLLIKDLQVRGLFNNDVAIAILSGK